MLMNKKLYRALNRYHESEFDFPFTNEHMRDTSFIGIAYTEIYEDDEPIHDMQIALNLDKGQVEYYLDGEINHIETYKSEKALIEDIATADFEDWYSDFLRYCPENYH